MRYGFYPGCSYKSEAGYKDSVESVSRLIGIDLVELIDWNCCGATSFFSLNESDAFLITGRVFALANRQNFDEIVTPCNACYTTLRKAKKSIENDSGLKTKINERLKGEGLTIERLPKIRHLLEVFYHDVPASAWSSRQSRDVKGINVAAYYGCQLTRPWSDMDHPERPSMLDQFIKRLGYTVIDHSARTLCCGASHFFPYEDKCRPLIQRITGEAARKGAHLITTLCPLCQLNLDAGQEKDKRPLLPIPYFTQLAGLALGISPRDLGLHKLLVPMDTLVKTFR